MAPSVAAPGDTNPSDATAPSHYHALICMESSSGTAKSKHAGNRAAPIFLSRGTTFIDEHRRVPFLYLRPGVRYISFSNGKLIAFTSAEMALACGAGYPSVTSSVVVEFVSADQSTVCRRLQRQITAHLPNQPAITIINLSVDDSQPS